MGCTPQLENEILRKFTQKNPTSFIHHFDEVYRRLNIYFCTRGLKQGSFALWGDPELKFIRSQARGRGGYQHRGGFEDQEQVSGPYCRGETPNK